MGEVQRYYLRTNPINGVSYMAPVPGKEPAGGEYVTHEDFAALTAKYEAERAAREADAADARRWRALRRLPGIDAYEQTPATWDAFADVLAHADETRAAIEGAPR